MFWKTVGARLARPQDVMLSEIGKTTEDAILNIPLVYPRVTVDAYVIMPNHIHLLLQIHSNPDGRARRAPTIHTVICQTKGRITKQIGKSIWQKLYHDHIIRNQDDYEHIAAYIYNNPINWHRDCFYTEE